MAAAPTHKLGQLLGHLVERSIRPCLVEVADARDLYLDYQDKKRPARPGRKVSWRDAYGNQHDLDYVLERDGSDNVIGSPIAFIEVAWRRYTKHSRNKVQEIQGAILPLAEKHQESNPFLGAVLAGEFTATSLEQLRSLGFKVLHFPYGTLVEAFASESLDIRFDEQTPNEVTSGHIARIEAALPPVMERIEAQLIGSNSEKILSFREALMDRIDRKVERVIITPLYGTSREFESIDAALLYVETHGGEDRDSEFQKYEVSVRFVDGDSVRGSFRRKARVRQFLRFVEEN